MIVELEKKVWKMYQALGKTVHILLMDEHAFLKYLSTHSGIWGFFSVKYIILFWFHQLPTKNLTGVGHLGELFMSLSSTSVFPSPF